MRVVWIVWFISVTDQNDFRGKRGRRSRCRAAGENAKQNSKMPDSNHFGFLQISYHGCFAIKSKDWTRDQISNRSRPLLQR